MKTLWFVFVGVLLLFSGCKTNPVLVEPTCQVSVMSDQMEVMKKAIIRAATRRRWSAVELKPGAIHCTLLNRTHEVQVDVIYTENNFTIRYANSQDMDYDPAKRTINRKYNQWVRNLEKEILIQISRSSL
ncbi:MAG: hypothetical protein J6U40_05335 [Kiritimatiellae bacterium]|nr:hypothetical protein [Kiritimatiellia bacterium]MBP5227576.1 hypothetical protein [Kiritimatiellia bacterium]